jgi:hypothetical protein
MRSQLVLLLLLMGVFPSSAVTLIALLGDDRSRSQAMTLMLDRVLLDLDLLLLRGNRQLLLGQRLRRYHSDNPLAR